MKKIYTLLLLCSAAFTYAQSDSTATLPDLTVKNMDGEDILLSDYGKNGKITVISFWATWCKHNAQLPRYALGAQALALKNAKPPSERRMLACIF